MLNDYEAEGIQAIVVVSLRDTSPYRSAEEISSNGVRRTAMRLGPLPYGPAGGLSLPGAALSTTFAHFRMFNDDPQKVWMPFPRS